MIENPSAAPTCTVITADLAFSRGVGEDGWERVRSGESGSSGRQAGDRARGDYGRRLRLGTSAVTCGVRLPNGGWVSCA
jgi:hypothetical protein